ncbi:hypothetical protein RJ639_008464 [Escallonia herrerae]|uniref:Uncharacterized protein n=1 Tax=Escallonia herrerae TaxID=1293975 RepID=A0AA88VTV4_9ASTE|nr:hypothetical protein RJ639_008464 [Escallonia herrerae]
MEPEIKHVSRQGSGTETKRMSPENIAQNVVEMISKEIKEQEHKSSFKKDDPCIYKVPNKLCQEKGTAYTPRVVSIGPIHQTLRAVSTGSVHNTPHAVSTEPIHNTPHAVSIGPIQNDEQPFLEMEGIKVNYVNRLFRQTASSKLKEDVDALIRECARKPDLECGTREDTDSKSRSNGCLSWLYGTTGTPLPKQPYHPIMKHSATELASAGIIFTPREAEDLDVEFNTSCWFHWFCGPRTSDIPPCCIYNRRRSSHCFVSWFFLLCGKTRFAVRPLFVDDSTEPLLRNLIAFEQCYPGIQRYVTSDAFLMYTLIDNEADVELLENAGVIQENLGARESTSKLFKDLCKEVVLADFSFLAQWKEVHDYCKSYSHTNLARVRRNCAALRKYYFSNRWAVI